MAIISRPAPTGETTASTREPARRSRSPSRRVFLRVALSSALGAGLAGCGLPFATPASQSSQDAKLVYSDVPTGWYLPMAQQMLEQFHAAHPNIRVFFVPEPEKPEDLVKKTLADMEAGTAADVYQGCCYWFPIWAQKGHLLDLRPYVKADLDQATIADWDPAQYNYYFTKDGKQYALPKYHGGLALYYNKDLFDRYRVSYPEAGWTHDEYLAAMKRLTRDENGDGETDVWGSMTYITWDRLQMHVNGWGGHLVDPDDNRRSRMGDPEALAAFQWLRDRMWQDRVMGTALRVNNLWPSDAFAAGRIAMCEDGSWQLKNILSTAKFRLGVAPFPAGPVRRVTLATTDGFGIYAGTKNPDAAWELVKFLISKEFGLAMARAQFLQPARASLIDQWAGYIRAEFPDKTRDVDLAAFADGQRKGYSVTGEVAADMGQATRIAQDAWDQYLTYGEGTSELIRNAARAIEKAQQAL